MQSKYFPLTITVKDAVDEKKFMVPKYQRSVVWKQKRREAFMETVRKGDPFGIILVRQKNDKYELIDGLQRITTLKKYRENKFDYLSKDDINEKLVRELIEKNLEIQGLPLNDEYLNKQTPDLQEKIYNCISSGLKNYEVMACLHNEHGFKQDSEIDLKIDEIFQDFEKSTNIDGLTIMAIDYQGSDEDIPTVFYHMNTGGVTLSKYETYAALWASWNYKIEDDEILKKVIGKYEGIEKSSDLDVDFNSDDIKENGITLFEYCYALSEILREKCKDIFGTTGKSTDPLGFELITLLLGEQVNKAEKLGKILHDAPNEFLINLKNTIVNSCIEIQTSLRSTVIGLNDSALCSDSAYLIYHIVCSYISHYYYIDAKSFVIKEKIGTLKKVKFYEYLPLHYVHDSITDYWKLHRQVSELRKDLDDPNKNEKYWHEITPNEWQLAINYFLEEQKTSFKQIPYNNKLFLDFYTRLKLDAYPMCKKYFKKTHLGEEDSVSIDIEHIIPQDVITTHLKDLSANSQKIFPISHIGNLCYLAAKDNRSKKEKTIYEFKDGRPSYVSNDEYVNFLRYPEESKLQFINYANDKFREEYMKFIEERAYEIRDEFLQLLKSY